jgi:hypothetical protein
MIRLSPLSALCSAKKLTAAIEAGLGLESFLKVGPEEVFGSHEVLRVFAIERELLAEAHYGPVDFKQNRHTGAAGNVRTSSRFVCGAVVLIQLRFKSCDLPVRSARRFCRFDFDGL